MLILFWRHPSDLREHSIKAANAAKAGSHSYFRNAAAVLLQQLPCECNAVLYQQLREKLNQKNVYYMNPAFDM